jgi:DNA-binding MarR family transcriptional regulator
MARERPSWLQRRLLAWLVAEEQRLKGTMAAEHRALVRAMQALGYNKGNVSTSLKGLERKGMIRVQRTPGGQAEAVDLMPAGRTLAEVVNKETWAALEKRNQALEARIRAMHASGLTKRQIANWLNQAGEPAGTVNGRWDVDTVLAWLETNAWFGERRGSTVDLDPRRPS